MKEIDVFIKDVQKIRKGLGKIAKINTKIYIEYKDHLRWFAGTRNNPLCKAHASECENYLKRIEERVFPVLKDCERLKNCEKQAKSLKKNPSTSKREDELKVIEDSVNSIVIQSLDINGSESDPSIHEGNETPSPIQQNSMSLCSLSPQQVELSSANSSISDLLQDIRL